MNSAKVIKVICVEFLRGEGVEGDQVRRVVQFWSLGGELLAECGAPVVCIPDGQPMCEDCAEKELPREA